MTVTPRVRRSGLLLAAFSLLLGLGATAAAPATPAQAGPGSAFENCFPVPDGSGQIVDWICIPIPVEREVCENCPLFAIELDHLTIPDDIWYLEDLAGGLQLLGEAAHADPRRAAMLREAAQLSFLAAAERLGEGQVQVGATGALDRERMEIEPPPVPWLVSAGIDLAGGLTLLQHSLVNPDPQPWRDAAEARFDAAFEALMG